MITTSVPFENEVLSRLVRIEAHAETASALAKDHEVRVRKLETRQWLFAGAVMALQPVLAKLGIHLPGLS